MNFGVALVLQVSLILMLESWSIFPACEAGESIKPGALAPGPSPIRSLARDSGRKREIAVARFTGSENTTLGLPGADAPGFMLFACFAG